MKTHLVFQKDNSHKFWNIEVEGKTHTVHYGRVGTDGQIKTKEFADEAAALKDANKLIASKVKKGYEAASAESNPTASSPVVKAEPPVRVRVVRSATTFVDKPIKEVVDSMIFPSNAVKVAFNYDDEIELLPKLDELSKNPDIEKIDTLVIGAFGEARQGEGKLSTRILERLIQYKNKFSSLKHLFVGDMTSEDCEMSWIQQTDYSDFYQHFPALETLGIKGGEGLKLGKINLPNLRHLVIETGGMKSEVIFDIAQSDLPNLEHLELWLGTNNYGCTVEVEDLKRILNGDYPKLKYLGLKNYYKADELAQILKGTAALKKIETLDLSMGTLTDIGAYFLFPIEELQNLKYINLEYHFLSEAWQAKMRGKFEDQNINLARPNKADIYKNDVYYYVQIGE